MLSPSIIDEVSREPEREILKLDGESFALRGLAIAVVSDGRAELRLSDGDCARADTGDLILVPPDAACWLGGHRSRAEIMVARISPWWVGAACGLAAGSSLTLPLQQVALERSGTDLARHGDRLLRRLCGGVWGDGVAANLRYTALLLELAALPFECRPGVHKPSLGRRSARHRTDLESTLSALREESLDGLCLRSVAARLSLSERQVSRLFQEQHQCSFREWATGVRLERARRLLAESELPIIEIAAETGWSSLGHFNALFLRRVGRTPGAFRALHRPREERRAG